MVHRWSGPESVSKVLIQPMKEKEKKGKTMKKKGFGTQSQDVHESSE